jgi:hypothetical protein
MRALSSTTGTAILVALAAWPSDRVVASRATVDVDRAIDRFIARSVPTLTSYRGTRRLMASTRGGKMQGFLLARTHFDATDGFRYEVIESGGSQMIQKRVLVAALETERQVQQNGTGARGALTADNYEFAEPPATDPTLVRVDLKPRRKDTMLLDGAMFLAPDDFDLVRVEGLLVKRPSFWTRKVNVVRRYGRIAGVRVPVAMESTAHVLIVGTSSFSMTYEYEMVNGTEIGAVEGR